MSRRILLLLGTVAAAAFCPSHQKSTCSALFLTPEEQRAAAMAAYYAKSHEDKLKAIAAVEQAKQAEIERLKAEIQALKASGAEASTVSSATSSTSTAPSTANLQSLSQADLIATVQQYQAYMAKYMVEALEQKAKAVQAAEKATAAKYLAKLEASGGASTSTPAPAPATSSGSKSLFAQRNERVKAAAAASKSSRWGSAEIARVQSGTTIASLSGGAVVATQTLTEASTDVVQERNEKLQAASAAGKSSRWSEAELQRASSASKIGSIGTAATTTPSTSASSSTQLYQERNEKVQAAVAAGQSPRWSDAEVRRVSEGVGQVMTPPTPAASTTSAVTPSAIVTEDPELDSRVEAANHGLHADGGVGGSTLSERVRLGVNAGASAVEAAQIDKASLYEQRNQIIARAAAAGKTRWGSEETQRVQDMVGDAGGDASGGFILSKTGEPTAAELADENIYMIVTNQCTDEEVNMLVWKCLGYRFDGTNWNSEKCFPKWRERYPTPPDLIGIRVDTKEVDQASLEANQAIVRSVPQHASESLAKFMTPLGWTEDKYAALTPNKSRREHCANWLLYYREELFGYSVEELRQRQRARRTKSLHVIHQN